MSWAEIKKAVNSNLDVPLNEGGVKIVKSVQSGSATGSATITISSVNVSKSIVILNARSAHNTSYSAVFGTGAYVSSFSSTSISVNATHTFPYSNSYGTTNIEFKMPFSWQVIEFY